ncbi:hypothetical protein [Selenihalanaerobacter shriftii]|uniref:Uncharacterized protein n=1 Tax=Selenihalanaerobacter shriftii TaxID=142842 RepID=A0A1T4MHG4_9FIRM|nr:hypothetical protein [Selenihalanaerobacter shriftii]SJZ66301.1 hypothetical protein SAMN02745118_01466 [Selenihalanaerobacter shriftii]
MGVGTLVLLAVLVSIDSFYSGLVYKKECGEIEYSNLLIILGYIIILITITTLLGRLTFILAGTEISKLISVLLLGAISLLFYIIMKDPNKTYVVNNKFKRIKVIEDRLSVGDVEEDKMAILIKLGIITSVDVAVVSFIAATITNQLLLIIIIFSFVDLFSIKAGNLISIE